ncbi:MAG: CRISPR-associated helicase Cas3' [Eubacteriales bacterium]|nr:CRISPR-associated helicase Cas3' [Eubacteriales bacterium]
MELQARQAASLWAKKEERESRFFWLPLTTHLADTMNVTRWLWNNWLSSRQKEFCVQSIKPSNEETAANLAAFLGAIHDIGKATPAFQIQKGYGNSPDLDAMLLEKLEQAGFRGISVLNLTYPRKSHHSIAGEYLLKKEFHVKDDIGSIIGGHHGKPVDSELDVEDQSAYTANYFQSENEDSDIASEWKNAQEKIFHWALSESEFTSAKDLPELSKPCQVIYSGLLIMADWISSNTEYFPLRNIDADSVPDSEERCRNGVVSWMRNLPLQISSYPSMNELFTSRFGFKPRNFQEVVYKTAESIHNPGILILEAPMGLGKTEAALAAAEEIAAKTGSSGLFFGLPTQATSNGMFGRVHQWLEHVTDYYGSKQSLRLCHGKAALNEEMNQLKTTSSNAINIDEEENGGIFVNEWFSGRKKTSLDDFVVGTVDGFLLSALKQKHLALRHLGFSKKIVIIDEVHAYDTYMQQYLYEAIRWMGAYGAPVILASATLPKDRRKELITQYLLGKGVKKKDIAFPEALDGTSYPLISYTDKNEVHVQTDFSPTKDKVIQVNRLHEEDLFATIENLLDDGGVLGIIVNTVKRAQRLGEECKARFGSDTVDVLHSAFIAEDRVKKESDLMKMIGKNGNRPERKIIIGTQVIEQSLDIDFDVLITDLCPVDLLLQRIGRLHRHDIERPEKLAAPAVYIMGTDPQFDFEKGTEYVYGKYLLIRTQYHLPEEIRIPSDIPLLINQVYGDEKLTLPEELQSIYQKSKDEMEIIHKKKEESAHVYRIERPLNKIEPDKEKYTLIGWLKNPDYSNTEEKAAAQVRDAAESIEVIAVKKIGNGYGIFGQEQDISTQIDDPKIAKELAKQTIRLPHFAVISAGISKTIEYLEKYNLTYLPKWQNQPWLRGTLGIIFDKDGQFELNGIILKYDKEFGLREVKENG